MRWIALQACSTEPAQLGQPDQKGVQYQLASLVLAFTPRVVLFEEAVLMDVTASLRLFGGLRRLVELMQQRLASFFATHQLQAQARHASGATSLIALGKLRQQLHSRAGELPVHTLSAARPHLDVLERTGCRTWNDLLALPRDGLARRFGAGLLAALDRARGAAPDAYDWLVLPEHFKQTLALDALLTHGPELMTGVERLLPSLQAWLLGRQHGLSALELTLHMDPRRDVAPTVHLVVRTDQPAQDLQHIQCLVAEHLAQQTLAAPVHSITLKSLVTEPLVNAAAATPSLLIEDRQTGGSALALVERLSARLGDARVRVWQPCADHRPEQMQQWVPAKTALQFITAPAAKARAPKGNDAQKGRQPTQRLVSDTLYPSWLLSEPLALRSVGNSPVYQGRLQRLAGPQRLESCGWLIPREDLAQPLDERARPPAIRDYFIYRSEQAGLLWIYSERLTTAEGPDAVGHAAPQRAWFLHGFFA